MLQYKISIVVPVFNGERYVSDTIESCLRQSYTNIEIIIIDDCSTDNSVNIVKSIIHNNLKSNAELLFIRNEINLGLSRSINKAVGICTGDLVLVLGHDDIILPDHISNMLLMEKLDDISLIYCNASVIDIDGKRIGRKIYSDSKLISKNANYLRSISQSNFIPSCGLLFKREFFLEVGGWDERFKNYGEWLLWIKLAHRGKFVLSKTDTAFYRVHESNISRTFKNKNVGVELRKYFSHCQAVALSFEMPLSERLYINLFHILAALYKSIVNDKGVFE